MTQEYRLIYRSATPLQASEPGTKAEIAQILAASVKNNAGVGVTGALLFDGHSFLQVLEGSREILENTFERIGCDPRHGNLMVLEFVPISTRSFAEWRMVLVNDDADLRERFEGILAGLDLSEPSTPHGVGLIGQMAEKMASGTKPSARQP